MRQIDPKPRTVGFPANLFIISGILLRQNPAAGWFETEHLNSQVSTENLSFRQKQTRLAISRVKTHRTNWCKQLCVKNGR